MNNTGDLTKTLCWSECECEYTFWHCLKCVGFKGNLCTVHTTLPHSLCHSALEYAHTIYIEYHPIQCISSGWNKLAENDDNKSYRSLALFLYVLEFKSNVSVSMYDLPFRNRTVCVSVHVCVCVYSCVRMLFISSFQKWLYLKAILMMYRWNCVSVASDVAPNKNVTRLADAFDLFALSHSPFLLVILIFDEEFLCIHICFEILESIASIAESKFPFCHSVRTKQKREIRRRRRWRSKKSV